MMGYSPLFAPLFTLGVSKLRMFGMHYLSWMHTSLRRNLGTLPYGTGKLKWTGGVLSAGI
jgi:hypothetical protein